MILTKDDRPFRTKEAARLRAGVLLKDRGLATEIVEHDGGFALKELETRVENERRRYWLFKKMEPLRGKLLRAIVLARRKKTYTVLLPDYLLELNTRLPGDRCYDPGCELQVILSEVDPFYGSIGVCLPDGDT